MISTVLPYRGRNCSHRSTRWLLSLVANLRLVSTLRGGMTSVTLLTLAARADSGVPVSGMAALRCPTAERAAVLSRESTLASRCRQSEL